MFSQCCSVGAFTEVPNNENYTRFLTTLSTMWQSVIFVFALLYMHVCCICMWPTASYTCSIIKNIIHCDSSSRQLWYADSYTSYYTSTSRFSVLNMSNFFWPCATDTRITAVSVFSKQSESLINQEVNSLVVNPGFLRRALICKEFGSPLVKSVLGLLKIK